MVEQQILPIGFLATSREGKKEQYDSYQIEGRASFSQRKLSTEFQVKSHILDLIYRNIIYYTIYNTQCS